MYKPTPTLDNLSTSAVINLMFYRYAIEQQNDVKARTKLMYKHPEVFDEDIIREIFTTHMQIKSQRIQRRQTA